MIEANPPAHYQPTPTEIKTAENLERLTSLVERVVQDRQPPALAAPIAPKPADEVGTGRLVTDLPWFESIPFLTPDAPATRRLDAEIPRPVQSIQPPEPQRIAPPQASIVPENRDDAGRHMPKIDDRHMPKISEPVESIWDRAGSAESEKKVSPESVEPADLQPKNNVTHEIVEDAGENPQETAKSADLQPKTPEITQPKIEVSDESIWDTAQKTPEPEPISSETPESEPKVQPKTELTEDGHEDTGEKAEEGAEAGESDDLEPEGSGEGSEEESDLDVGADVGDLFGMDQTAGAWRPVKFCRKADRPLVTVEGTKLSPSGGGFVQRYQTSLGGAYVQFFTRDAITRLENEILTPADRRRLKPQARKGKPNARKPKAE